MNSKAKIVKKQTKPNSEPASIKVGRTDFLKEFRNKTVSGSKITHPFAKYNASGQLQCVICSLQIPNEKGWSVHVQTRKHKDTMSSMKTAATKTTHRESVSKTVVSSVQSKQLKSILKTTHSTPAAPPPDVNSEVVTSSQCDNVPSDLFDTSSLPPSHSTEAPSDVPTEEVSTAEAGTKDKMSEALPEGFFDDPRKDAKVRGVKPEEAMEKEWESFQKLIENDNEQSEMIVTQQDQLDQLERDFSETHQQNYLYTRAEELRKQQETINSEKRVTVSFPTQSGVRLSNNEGSNSDSETELDWRAQTY